ncbi:ATP-dependent nuclease [Asticcacaulis tiandongensis]|uniref:ATP-dependent nuclease n=1 Tax=Asticcacaulis tiandongensis TaxID=2565365 RepID=UPI00112B8DA0|nr:AAA family ATPase [Asticcacaulis tiandongensis]
MKYKSFQIKNFKGIKDTTINFDGIGGAAVFALVGLNESGKTTVLEAIHSFSPDSATSELLGGEEGTGVPFNDRVPRHLISTFTGDVSVIATLSASEEDKKNIAKRLREKHGLEVNISTIPDLIVFERKQRFKDGDFQKNFFNLTISPQVKSGSQRKWRDKTSEEYVFIRDVVYSFTPDIAYFPTFVFNFPERIFLTERGGAIDKFYRRVFQDILDFDGHGHTIEKDIVRRVRGEGMVVPWHSFFSTWVQHDDRTKIQHVMDRASAAVTKLVFGRWNKIFGENTHGKEVVISFETIEGEKENSAGMKEKTNEHDVYIKFQIRDGTRRFNVNDRSLGFRWFFAFMLFTQFRVSRSSTRPLLFLFDEPASNLHSAAQQKLIESFPEVAKGEHTLAYSTHSHYMIEPKWLEQTFIVTNRADAPLSSVLDDISLDDESLDIQVASYRSFVNANPTQTSYFQPILDRLQVVPSRFDIQRASVVLEGKSDYYILRYAAQRLGKNELPLLPGLGAGTLGALVALHVGWNLNFLFMLDSDHQGKVEKGRYITDYGMPVQKIVTIEELVPGLKMIEDLLDNEAKDNIQKELGLSSHPNKNQIRRFFQERLASSRVNQLSSGFIAKAKSLLEAIEQKLAS